MNIAFISWEAFFAMGGYGLYVWLAVALTLLSLIGLLAHTTWQHKKLLIDIKHRRALEKRMHQSQSATAVVTQELASSIHQRGN